MVLLLFFVLGPFALPLLYKSPRFNKTFKIILTIVVIVYTSYLMVVSLKVWKGVYTEIQDIQNLISQ